MRREHVESIMRSCAAKGEGFDDIKLGDAWIGHIGFPSIGKNTLLNTLTNAFRKSKKENSPHWYIYQGSFDIVGINCNYYIYQVLSKEPKMEKEKEGML